jgi:hypothetical protein
MASDGHVFEYLTYRAVEHKAARMKRFARVAISRLFVS